ncbi:MAG TPA: phosphatidylglycerol lysyltransferase domain-containing protein [Syntrophales bacterium]|nr:phosphatidylglycerol lysyltransferase domain-containing protein [Syntrophales bacterium]
MEFKQLEVSDYANLKDFFRNQRYRLCNYSLLSLIVWSNQQLKTYYSLEDSALFICNRSAAKPADDHLILPISPRKDLNPEYLVDLARDIGLKNYWFVPEDYFARYGASKIESYFRITEQDAFDDYVYLKEDLVSLKGNRFAKQRNLIHQFRKKYLNKHRVNIEFINEKNSNECVDFLQEWCEARNCDSEDNESLACEKLATLNALNNIDALEAQGILIRIDGAVSAFGIGSHLTHNMGVLNFEKANAAIKGLYQFLDNECAKQLFGDYEYINKESDMKLPNLAQSKRSYNPVSMVKSFCLSLKD